MKNVQNDYLLWIYKIYIYHKSIKIKVFVLMFKEWYFVESIIQCIKNERFSFRSDSVSFWKIMSLNVIFSKLGSWITLRFSNIGFYCVFGFKNCHFFILIIKARKRLKLLKVSNKCCNCLILVHVLNYCNYLPYITFRHPSSHLSGQVGDSFMHSFCDFMIVLFNFDQFSLLRLQFKRKKCNPAFSRTFVGTFYITVNIVKLLLHSMLFCAIFAIII